MDKFKLTDAARSYPFFDLYNSYFSKIEKSTQTKTKPPTPRATRDAGPRITGWESPVHQRAASTPVYGQRYTCCTIYVIRTREGGGYYYFLDVVAAAAVASRRTFSRTVGSDGRIVVVCTRDAFRRCLPTRRSRTPRRTRQTES